MTKTIGLRQWRKDAQVIVVIDLLHSCHSRTARNLGSKLPQLHSRLSGNDMALTEGINDTLHHCALR
jgi:hypothetical protein